MKNWCACILCFLIAACSEYHRVQRDDSAPPAAEPLSASIVAPATGLQLDTARMAHRQLEVPAVGVRAGSAAAIPAGAAPRVIILVNRAFSADDAQFRADSRLVLRYNGVHSEAEAGRGSMPRQLKDKQDSDQAVAQHEQRVEGGLALSQGEVDEIRRGFSRPFLKARVALVDPGASTRLQALSDSEKTQPAMRKDAQNIEAAAYRNRADILVEILAVNGREQPVVLTAKAVDLKSGDLLSVISSADALSIPGAPEPENASLEADAEGLGHRMIRVIAP